MGLQDEALEEEADLGGGKVLRGHPEAIRAFVAARDLARERNRRWPQRPNGSVDTRAAMTTLARSFPTLRDAADGVEPFEVERFARWLCSGAGGGGAIRAGRFVLHVWNPNADHRELGRELGLEAADGCLAPFNVSDALGVWDEEHRRAFLAWCEAPFWP
jgi:hypothetical protein